MTHDREALRRVALELVGRCGLSYRAAGEALRVSHNIIAGFDWRAQHPRKFTSKPRSFAHPRPMTYGNVRAAI